MFCLFAYLISYLCLATRGHDSLFWTLLLFWVILWSHWTALGRAKLHVFYQFILLF
jgi:hypothetical protein